MIIQMDTREQKGKKDHILSFFENECIKVVRSKLFVGDWTRLDKQDVCIDTKQGLGEVYCNVVQQHTRFRDECLRARQNGIKLVILVEEAGIRCLDDVCLWKNPRRKKWYDLDQQHQLGKKLSIRQPPKPPLGSDQLQSIMKTIGERYGIEWQFTPKAECGKRIVEILGGKNGEANTPESI
jgi:hypothetical protein